MEQDVQGQEGIITLEGDDGHSYSCQILDIFEFEGNEYALLLNLSEGGEPEGEAEDDGSSIVIMRLTQKDEQSIFQTIESEEEFERVVAHVEELVKSAQEEDEEA